jgi:hypothetical protein
MSSSILVLNVVSSIMTSVGFHWINTRLPAEYATRSESMRVNHLERRFAPGYLANVAFPGVGTMSAVFFEKLGGELERLGLNSWVEVRSEDEPFDQMHILTSVDEQGRSYLLRIVGTLSQEERDPSASMDSLEMALIFPFRVLEASYDDTARLLAATNLGLLIGTLGMVEADGVVMLRHVWHAPHNAFDVGQAIFLIDLMRYVSAELGPLIEQVAAGELRYAELQKALRAAVDAGFTGSVSSFGMTTV